MKIMLREDWLDRMGQVSPGIVDVDIALSALALDVFGRAMQTMSPVDAMAHTIGMLRVVMKEDGE